MKEVIKNKKGVKITKRNQSSKDYKTAKRQMNQQFKLDMAREKTKQLQSTNKAQTIKATGSAVAKNVASGSAGVAASKATSALSQNGYQQILNPIIDEQGKDANGNDAIDGDDGLLVP